MQKEVLKSLQLLRFKKQQQKAPLRSTAFFDALPHQKTEQRHSRLRRSCRCSVNDLGICNH